MLAYHDASIGIGGIRRDGHSGYNDDFYAKPRHQVELNELQTSKTRRCLKKTTKFLFSHIGLVGLVVIYAVAGGFLFQLLEERQEKLNCQETQGDQQAQLTKLKRNLVSYIQNNATPTSITTMGTKDNATVAIAKINTMLFDYRDYILRTSSRYRTYGDNCSIVNKWTYANSLLFAITVITTIGYGNITPMTPEGQLCSICYATIGIPIFLLCVANISGVLGEMFRFLYSKIICGPCFYIKRRRAKARKAKLEEETGIGRDRTRTQGYTLNDDNKTNTGKRLSNSMTAEEIDEEEQRRNDRIAVPLTVTMIIIAAYIWIGSALFHSFEGWSMMQAGYFCFITLATIGFGDFVPGQRKDDPNAGPKLILGAVYVLFGMAILAMCFDLMQEEIVAKFRWIGTKIGIVEKQEDIQNQLDKMSTTKSKRNSSINATINTSRTMIPNESPTNTTRKSSPRNNIARIHPVGTNSSNEATLHQRIAAAKPD